MAGEDTLGTAVLGTEVSLKGLDEGISEAEARAESGFSRIGNIISGALKVGLAAAAAGVVAFGAVLKGGIDDARAHQLVMAQTQQVITSMGNAAGVSAEHVESFAASLSAAEGRSLFGDDQVQAATNMLLTFGNIKGEMLDFATVLTVDMAQALKKTPEDMSIMVGKLLNSADAMSAAQRMGVSFSDEQLKLGKRLFETGRIAEYQKLVLDELNKEFGGQAEAAAKADGGWAQFHDRLGEAAETMGAAVLPLLSEVAGFLNGTVAPAVESAAQLFADLVSDFQSGGLGVVLDDIREMTGIDLAPLVGVFQDVTSAAQGLFDIFFNRDFTGGIFGLQEDDPIIDILFGIRDAAAGLISTVGELANAIGAFAQGDVGGGFDFLSNILPPDVAATIADGVSFVLDQFDLLKATFTDAASPIEGFLAVLSEVSPAFALLSGVAEETLPQVLAIIESVFGDILSFVQANGTEMLGQALTTWQSIHDTVLSLVEPLAGIVNAVLGQIQAFWDANGQDILAFVGSTWTEINSIIRSAMELIQLTIVPILQAIAQFISDHGTEIQTVLSVVWENIKAAIDIALALIGGIIRTVLAAVKGDWNGAWEEIKGTVDRVWKDIQTIIDNTLTPIKNAIAGAWEDIKSAASTTWDGIKSTVSSKLGELETTIKELPGKLIGVGAAIVNEVWNGLKARWDEFMADVRGKLQEVRNLLPFSEPRDSSSPLYGLGKAGESIIGQILGGLESRNGDLARALGDDLQSLVGELDTTFGQLSTSTATALDDIVSGGVAVMADASDALSDVLRGSSIPEDAEALGDDIIAGLLQGVIESLPAAARTMRDAAGDLLGGMADGLGIASPSTEFAELGEMSMLGWIQGMLDSFPDLLNTLSGLGDDLLSEAQSIADSIASALQSGFEAEANLDRQKARNIKALQEIGTAAMDNISGTMSQLTAIGHQAFVKSQLEEAERAAAAMNDPEQAAKFYKMRSAQIFELAKLQEQLAAAGSDDERNRIREQIKLIQDAQQAEQKAFKAGQAKSGASGLARLAEDLQKFLLNDKLPGILQDTSGVIQRLFDMLQQLNRAAGPPPATGQHEMSGLSRLPESMSANVMAERGTTISIAVDARGAGDPRAVEEAGYRGAKRALDEAGIRADVYQRTRR